MSLSRSSRLAAAFFSAVSSSMAGGGSLLTDCWLIGGLASVLGGSGVSVRGNDMGGACIGGARMGGTCMGGACMGGACMGGPCMGGACMCRGGPCMYGACTGGTGIGGIWNPMCGTGIGRGGSGDANREGGGGPIIGETGTDGGAGPGGNPIRDGCEATGDAIGGGGSVCALVLLSMAVAVAAGWDALSSSSSLLSSSMSPTSLMSDLACERSVAAVDCALCSSATLSSN